MADDVIVVDDCLEIIHSFLTTSEMILAREVCVKWRSMLEKTLARRKSMTIDHSDFHGGGRMIPFTHFVEFITEYSPMLTTLHINTIAIKFEDLLKLMRSELFQKSLEFLDIQDCSMDFHPNSKRSWWQTKLFRRKMCDARLVKAIGAPQRLRKVRLIGNAGLDLDCVRNYNLIRQTFIKSCSQITDLEISDFLGLPEDAIRSLTELRKLTIHERRKWCRGMGKKMLITIQLPKLDHLIFNYDRKLFQEESKAFFLFCWTYGDAPVPIISSIKTFQSNHIALIFALTEIESLEVNEQVDNYTFSTLRHYATSVPNKIKVLKICGSLYNEESTQFIRSFKHIEQLFVDDVRVQI